MLPSPSPVRCRGGLSLPAPLVVLSSLAEGADQIAAEAALDPSVGAFVRVPLPLEPNHYANSTSFGNNEAARANFWTILNSPRVESFVVPLAPGLVPPNVDWAAVATIKADGPEKTLRHRCYANAGAYLARRCHAMVALWDGPDGSPPHGPSGTEEHVNFKLIGEPPEHFPWRETEPLGFRGERGLVFVVHTPRQNDRSPSGTSKRPAGQIRVLVPNDRDEILVVPDDQHPVPRRLNGWKRFSTLVKASLGVHARHDVRNMNDQIAAEVFQFRDLGTTIDDFNKDLEKPKVIADVLKCLRKKQAILTVHHFDPTHNSWLLRLSRLHEAADVVSNRLQPWLDGAIVTVFGLLGFSAYTFHMYAHFYRIIETPQGKSEPIHQPLWLLASMLLFGAAMGLVAIFWWKRTEQRRLDSRALAEALRVRRTWSMTGVSKSVADSYMSQLRGEVSWIRQALLHACPPPITWIDQFDRIADPKRQLLLLHRVRREWLLHSETGQIPQFKKRHHDLKSEAAKWRQRGVKLAILSWVCLIVILILGLLEPVRERLHPIGLASDEPGRYFLIATGILFIVGGLFIAYCERQAYEDLEKQYERMLIVFRYGDHELRQRLRERDIPGARRVFEALGREAILEQSQWLLLRRSRPLELHIGG